MQEITCNLLRTHRLLTATCKRYSAARVPLRGQRHPAAKLTDHEVDLIRRLHEQEGLGCRRIWAKLEGAVTLTQVKRILAYQSR